MGLPSREYELIVRQEPKQARMCGLGGKADRRPIDPPPIVQLRVIERTPTGEQTNVGQQAFLQNPYYFMFASLAHHETDEELHLLKDGKTRCTTGSIVSSLYHLKDAENHNQDAGFFVFPDLSVRTEGSYRLKFTLFEVIGPNVHHCKSLYSKAFYVYTAKKFPGMEESTRLSCSLADQGIKIRIRKDIRVRKRPVQAEANDGDDPDFEEGPIAGGPDDAGPSSKRLVSKPKPSSRPSAKRPRPNPVEPVTGPAPHSTAGPSDQWSLVPHDGQHIPESHPPPPPPPVGDRSLVHADIPSSSAFPSSWDYPPNPPRTQVPTKQQSYDIYPSPTSHISPYGPPPSYGTYPSAQQVTQQQQQQEPAQYPYPVSPPRGHPPPPPQPAAGPSPRDSYNYPIPFDPYTRSSGSREHYPAFPPQPQQSQHAQPPQTQTYPPPAMASPPHASYGYLPDTTTTRAPSAPASSTYGPSAASYGRSTAPTAPATSVGWQTAVPGPSYTYHRSPETAPQPYDRQLNDSREDVRYRDATAPPDAAPRHAFLPSPPDHRRHPHAPATATAPQHHDPSLVDRIQLAPLRGPSDPSYAGLAMQQQSQDGPASAGGVRESGSPVAAAYAPPVHQSTRYTHPLADPQRSSHDAYYPLAGDLSTAPYRHPRDYANREDLRNPPPPLLASGLHHERSAAKRNPLSIGSILQ